MELFSEEIKHEHLTDKFILIKQKGERCSYPIYIRDKGGIVIEFKKVHYYTGQDDRYKQEILKMWEIARRTLKALNI